MLSDREKIKFDGEQGTLNERIHSGMNAGDAWARSSNGLLPVDVTERTLSSQPDKKRILQDIWAKEKHRYIFDPFGKNIDFRDRRPTDYKLHKRVKLQNLWGIQTSFNVR